jgi:undecaprenyl-diphosphatase
LNFFLLGHDWVEDPVLAYERFSQLLFIAILVALFVVPQSDPNLWARRASVSAAFATGAALVAGQVLSNLVDRPRPFVIHPERIHLFAQHVADPGFPSDHATAAFAIAVAIFLRNRRWGAAVILLAVLLAVGRVAIGVHYPTDVLAGAALGTACALALSWEPITAFTDRIADAPFWNRLLLRRDSPDSQIGSAIRPFE